MRRWTTLAALAAAVGLALAVALRPAQAGDGGATGDEAPITGLGYRGINSSGHYPAEGLLDAWPEGGPELLWKYDVGTGYAGVTVAGGKVYVAGGEMSYLYVFTLDGQLEARIPVGGAGWKRFSGTRSTPLVRGNLAVTSTPDANLYAIDLESRSTLWQKNAWQDFGAGKGNMGWGYPESPLLDETKVIFNACSRFDETPPLIALDIRTGETVWEADAGEGKKYSAADTSGSLIRHNGRDLVIWPTWRYLLCLDADTGKRLWEIHDVGEKTITPVYGEGGYVLWDPKGRAEMLKLSKDGSTYRVLWCRAPLGGQFSQAVILDGRVYAFGDPQAEPVYPKPNPEAVAKGDDESEDCEAQPQPKERSRKRRGNALVCLDAATGKVLHHVPAAGPGHLIAADGMVYVVERVKTGPKKTRPRVSLLKPTKDGFEVTGRFTPDLEDAEVAIRDVEWQTSVNPVVAEGRLFLRYGPLQVYELRADRTAEIRARKARIAGLVERLGATRAEARLAALVELTEMGWQARPAKEALAAALSDPDERVRERSAALLGEIGPAAVPDLIVALKDKQVWKNGFAAKALVEATPDAEDLASALAGAAEASRAVREDVKAVLPRLGADCVEPLVGILGRGDRFVRWWAIEVLKELGPEARGAVEALIHVTRTGDQWFRALAAQVLGGIGKDALPATKTLVVLLDHGYADARMCAAEALGRIGAVDAEAFRALERLTKDEDEKVAAAAKEALERLRK